MMILYLPAFIILGWLLGSLINYLADVLPHTRQLSRADCPNCKEQRTLADYLLMRRCRKCWQRREFRAWVVPIVAVIVTVAQGLYPPARLGFWIGTLLLTYFGVVAVIDIEHRLILYIESAVGLVIGLPVGTWLHGFLPTLLGGVAGVLMMAGLYLLGFGLAKLFGKIRGKAIDEEALGFSDILLCGNLGLLLGWPGITAGVFYTIFIAGAGSLLIILAQLARRKYEPFSPVAFGPYMLLATVLLLYGPK